jgi:hypothetical protein
MKVNGGPYSRILYMIARWYCHMIEVAGPSYLEIGKKAWRVYPYILMTHLYIYFE